MVYTTVTIRPLFAEYFYSIFGKEEHTEGEENPIKYVRFPHKEYLYHTVCNLVQKRPDNVSPIDTGNFNIALPKTSEGKCPLIHNYISATGTKTLQRILNRRFFADFVHFMDEQTKEYGQYATDAVYLFMSKHNLKSVQHESLRKYYYRYEQTVREKINKRTYKKSS